MKKILAISGGIDSMVMLHIFKDDPSAVVAHFNHGTRPSSDIDEAFVHRQATTYNLPFYSQKIFLGPSASEEKARTARYVFLESLAKELDGEIYTAHHADDLIESIAINLLRGTGWRGLTPLSNNHHPFLSSKIWHKKDILKYAAKHSIVFRQDPTNAEPTYLRNRLRRVLISGTVPGIEEKMLSLWTSQRDVRQEVESTIGKVLPADTKIFPKDLFATAPPVVAVELLSMALKANKISLTRPQLADFLVAIKTYQPSKKFNLPHDQFVTITKTAIQLP